MTDSNIMTEKDYDADEVILKENPDRFVMFPIEYHDLWKHYKEALACFWVPEEISLTDDVKDWEKLNDDEKHFIKHILAFFAASDGIVISNLLNRFASEVQVPEAIAYYSQQLLIENIHSETYSLLIDTYITDSVEKNKMFKAVNNFPAIKKKADWALKWITDKEASFARRLICYLLVEGLFFSGAFCAIFWIKERGIMSGLTHSNELISRDEGSHTDFCVTLYKYLKHKLPQKLIHDIFIEAVAIEKEFILEALPCSLLGMNSGSMSTYIEYVADRLLSQLNYDKLYNVKNPFDFMELISMKSKTNFFEKRVAEYRKDGVNVDDDENEFGLDADF